MKTIKKTGIELIREYIEITQFMYELAEKGWDDRWQSELLYREDIVSDLKRRKIKIPTVKTI